MPKRTKPIVYPSKFPVRESSRNIDDPAYIKWREAVYARDGHQCQWPGCKRKVRLNAHHIKKWADFPALRFEVFNGITLCSFHHKKVTGAEEAFEKMFQQILNHELFARLQQIKNGKK